MKKLVLFLAVATAVAFASCGNKETKQEAPAEEPAVEVVAPVEEVTPEPEVAPVEAATPEGEIVAEEVVETAKEVVKAVENTVEAIENADDK